MSNLPKQLKKASKALEVLRRKLRQNLLEKKWNVYTELSVRKLYREAALAYHRFKPNHQKQTNIYRTWTHRILVCLYQILIIPSEKKKKSSIRYTPLLTLHFKVYHHHRLCQLCCS